MDQPQFHHLIISLIPFGTLSCIKLYLFELVYPGLVVSRNILYLISVPNESLLIKERFLQIPENINWCNPPSLHNFSFEPDLLFSSRFKSKSTLPECPSLLIAIESRTT